MDREILKFLYDFYNEGDYVGFHSLTPLFDKLNKGVDFKSFVDKLRTILGYLAQRGWIELDNTEYGSWGTKKEGDILFDYTHLPVKGRITSEGREIIEKFVALERQNRVDNSILFTNKLTRLNIGATILFGLIVTSLQIRGCVQDKASNSLKEKGLYQDSLRLLQQSKHDSIIEKLALRTSTDSICAKKK